MRKILNFIRNEELIIILSSLILLSFSYGPLLWCFLFPPKGKVFLGSFGYPPDFFGNFISFQEGRLGHWQHISKITSSVPAKPVFIRSEYNFLGQLSRFTPINPVVFFHLSRLILSIIFLVVSYFLINQIFKEKVSRITAFLLAFFSTTLDPSRGSLTDLWSPLSVFQRGAYYPHYLFSFIFILLALLFLSRALAQRKPKPLLSATLFGLLAAQIHPPTIISLYLTFPFYAILILMHQYKNDLNRGKKVLFQKIAYLTFFSLASCLPLIYLYKVSFTYPWDLISKVDLLFDISSVVSVWKFFIGIGPMVILAIIGSYLAIKIRKNGDLNFLLAPWSVVYIIGFLFIWKIISYNSARFLQTPFFVILGILSTFTISSLAALIAKKYHFDIVTINYCLVFFLLFLNLPAYHQSLKDNLLNFTHLHPYLNTSTEMVNALDWLSQNTQENEVVLSDATNGMLIAALAGNFPYINVHAKPLEVYSAIQENVHQFFQQRGDKNQIKQFLLRERIRLVFWGEEEKKLAPNQSLDYPFLVKVFENNTVTIYRVKL